MEFNNKNEVVFEFLSYPDNHGKEMFFMHWWVEYFPGSPNPGVRSQIFLSKRAQYIEEAINKGKEIRIIEYRGK